MESLAIIDMLLALDNKVKETKQCFRIAEDFEKTGQMNDFQVEKFNECKNVLKAI